MIIPLDLEHLPDVNRANEPFMVIGRLLPTYADGKWSWREELLLEPWEKRYADDEEDYRTYVDSPDRAIFLDYEDGTCAGQIVLRRDWNYYAFVEDISVAAAYRGKGVGTQLMERAKAWAREKSLGGLALETQDNNLLACRFYQKCGMEIGAVNSMLYKNAPKPWCDEIAIFWYLKFDQK